MMVPVILQFAHFQAVVLLQVYFKPWIIHDQIALLMTVTAFQIRPQNKHAVDAINCQVDTGSLVGILMEAIFTISRLSEKLG